MGLTRNEFPACYGKRDKSRYGVDLEPVLTGFPYQTQNSFCEFTPPYIREPDFFDGGDGSHWVLAIFFGIQLFLYGRTLIETRSFQTTTLIFGVTNIVVFVVCILFLNGVAVLAPVVDKPSGLTPDDWRYWGDFQRSWLNITSMICWWIGLLWIQPLFARARASTRQ